jgi:hypothetical protein
MPTILWWVIGVIGVLILLYLLHFAYRAIEARRLVSITFRFLTTPDVATALRYIDRHPKLLEDRVLHYIETLLDRVWADGDIDLLISGAMHLGLLAQCRQDGVESVRQMMDELGVALLIPKKSPGWYRALEVIGQLATEGKASVPPEELDEELVEAMSQVTSLLETLADEETTAALKGITQGLRQALKQKAKGALQPSSDTSATPSPSDQPRKQRKRKLKHR